MQVNKVQILESQACEHLVQLLECYAFAVLVGPEFGGNPDFFTGNAAVLHRLPHAALVLISVRGVDVPVTGF